jgi:3-mercaptopyruvate sulfurtransferase SseA
MTNGARSRILLLATAAALPAWSGCERETRDTDIKLVSIGQVKALWDRDERGETRVMYLVDPRPAKSFGAEHIPGAKNLTLPKVDPKADRDPMIQQYDNIVVYGDDPGSAPARGMTKRLLAVGYKHIRFFAGGLKEWKSRGYPTDLAPTPPEPPPEPKPPEPAPQGDPAMPPAATPESPK